MKAIKGKKGTLGARPSKQGGGFVLGMVAGLLIGLALALGVALYITKAPIPFLDKVPMRTAEHDKVEAERNRQWDPNAPLANKPGPRVQDGEAAASAPDGGRVAPFPDADPANAAGLPSALPSSRDPAAILSGSPVAKPAATPPATAAAPVAPPRSTAAALEPFIYFVQVGAYTRNEDAEQQRAKLGLMGLAAKVTEREQAGRTVYRVRLGPFAARDEADQLQQRLQGQAMQAQIVRVERP